MLLEEHMAMEPNSTQAVMYTTLQPFSLSVDRVDFVVREENNIKTQEANLEMT